MAKILAALWFLALGPLAAPLQAADDLLPQTLSSWRRTEVRRVEAATLEQLEPQDAALWREYGAIRAERAVYHQGPHRLTVTLYALRDPSGAYGAFSFLGAGGKPIELGEAGRQTLAGWVFYRGSYCVGATASRAATPIAALQELAAALARPGSHSSPLPALPAFLPQEGLQPNSERYLLGSVALGRLSDLGQGDWLGFAYGAEALWAEYQLAGRPASLLLASYPTPQLAADRLRELSQRFNLNGTGDPSSPLVYAKRVGPLVAVLIGVDSGAAASSLLSRLHYEFQVTWSEPTAPRKGPDWAQIVVGIFIGTGILLLYAVLSSLLFGGIRLLVSHYLPGKVFDRPEDVEIIRLDLGRR